MFGASSSSGSGLSQLREASSMASSVATDSVSGLWKNIKSQTGLFVNPEDPATYQEQSLVDEFSEMTSLTRMQRIYGFFMALAMGAVFFVIAITLLPTVALFPKKFAFFFTCGNLFLVMSTVFLVGFKKQFEVMFEMHRFQAASAYIASMFMCVVSALHWQSSTLALIFACVQLGAVLWYALSFIPFARQTISFVWSHLMVVLKPLCSLFMSGLWKLTKCVCSSCSR